MVEVIITLVVLAASVPPLLVALSKLQEENMMLLPMTTASHLARDQIEDVIEGTNFAGLDDVDITAFAAPFDSYRYAVFVDYVESNALDDVSQSPTNFKKVTIKITNNELPNLDVDLTKLVVDPNS